MNRTTKILFGIMTVLICIILLLVPIVRVLELQSNVILKYIISCSMAAIIILFGTIVLYNVIKDE